jgi:hypothetical protein
MGDGSHHSSTDTVGHEEEREVQSPLKKGDVGVETEKQQVGALAGK